MISSNRARVTVRLREPSDVSYRLKTLLPSQALPANLLYLGFLRQGRVLRPSSTTRYHEEENPQLDLCALELEFLEDEGKIVCTNTSDMYNIRTSVPLAPLTNDTVGHINFLVGGQKDRLAIRRPITQMVISLYNRANYREEAVFDILHYIPKPQVADLTLERRMAHLSK